MVICGRIWISSWDMVTNDSCVFAWFVCVCVCTQYWVNIRRMHPIENLQFISLLLSIIILSKSYVIIFSFYSELWFTRSSELYDSGQYAECQNNEWNEMKKKRSRTVSKPYCCYLPCIDIHFLEGAQITMRTKYTFSWCDDDIWRRWATHWNEWTVYVILNIQIFYVNAHKIRHPFLCIHLFVVFFRSIVSK